jgi:hypothetical protein
VFDPCPSFGLGVQNDQGSSVSVDCGAWNKAHNSASDQLQVAERCSDSGVVLLPGAAARGRGTINLNSTWKITPSTLLVR